MRDSFNLKKYLKKNPLLEADRYATVKRAGTYDPFTGKQIQKYISMLDPESYKELTGSKSDATGRDPEKRPKPRDMQKAYEEIKRLVKKVYTVVEDPRNSEGLVSKNPDSVVVYYDPGQVSLTGQKTEAVLEVTFNEAEKNTIDQMVDQALKTGNLPEKKQSKSGSAITYSWY
jgi:hypothetical protein